MSEDDHESTERVENQSAGGRIADDLSAFTALTGDFYRGEIDRSTAWRARLDQTTNWAVIVVAAILTWAFSGQGRPHYVILIGILGVTAFLLMEANRYREYDVWRDRVRTLQTDVIAEMFTPNRAPESDWRAQLTEELRNPVINISFHEALNHRLRRSYFALLLILFTAWIARISVYEPQEPWRQTASILIIPGEAVVVFVAVFYAILIVITVWSVQGTRTQEFQK